MRSVVVVFPASMCAMMPMLRTLARSSAAFVAMMARLLSRVCKGLAAGLPAVVREGLVGLSHLVGVLASLDRGSQTVGRVEQLVHQPFGHRLLAAGAGVGDQPAQRQGVRASG